MISISHFNIKVYKLFLHASSISIVYSETVMIIIYIQGVQKLFKK